MKIKQIKAREILDSRGNPTIEVDVITDKVIATASVPSGASTGSREALELRDNDTRYNGKGVQKAVNNVNTTIREALEEKEWQDIREVDTVLLELDGTENKSKLGANAILGVSLATLKAFAKEAGKELYEYIGNGKTLPVPMMNILNGGAHADNGLDFQEFMIIPNRDTVKERIRVGAEVFHALKAVLKKNGYNTGVGDEGGFAPNLSHNREALEYIMDAIKTAGYEPGKDVNLAMDVAASEFYDQAQDRYCLKGENLELNREEMIEYYEDLINRFPIISIEDAFDEDDDEGFKLITEKLGDKIQLVGDDLFVTNKETLQKGIDNGICNSILIKANQIGTVSETLDTIKLAKANGYTTVISHRSGETDDTFIADLAVGLDLGQIKTGSLSRMDRICKYNRLMKIEEELGE